MMQQYVEKYYRNHENLNKKQFRKSQTGVHIAVGMLYACMVYFS